MSEQCFTSPPTQYRLYERRLLHVKRPNQQHQSTDTNTTQTNQTHSKQTWTQNTASPLVYNNMGWLGDGSLRGQGCQAWTAVGLPPRYPRTWTWSQCQSQLYNTAIPSEISVIQLFLCKKYCIDISIVSTQCHRPLPWYCQLTQWTPMTVPFGLTWFHWYWCRRTTSNSWIFCVNWSVRIDYDRLSAMHFNKTIHTLSTFNFMLQRPNSCFSQVCCNGNKCTSR